MVTLESRWLSYATSLGSLGCRPRCSQACIPDISPRFPFRTIRWMIGSQHWQVTSVSVPDLGAPKTVTRGTLSCLESHVQPQIGRRSSNKHGHGGWRHGQDGREACRQVPTSQDLHNCREPTRLTSAQQTASLPIVGLFRRLHATRAWRAWPNLATCVQDPGVGDATHSVNDQ